MADITMCLSETCPKKHTCYRYTASPNPFRQAYNNFYVPITPELCGWFWPINPVKESK